LSPDYKRTIVDRYYYEIALGDISAKEDIPIGTTKSKLSRARALIRYVLQNKNFAYT